MSVGIPKPPPWQPRATTCSPVARVVRLVHDIVEEALREAPEAFQAPELRSAGAESILRPVVSSSSSSSSSSS